MACPPTLAGPPPLLHPPCQPIPPPTLTPHPTLAQLVSAGRVFEVLRWAEEWKQRADPSLVRHLVFGILEVSAPPYSPDFAGSMLRWGRRHAARCMRRVRAGASPGLAWHVCSFVLAGGLPAASDLNVCPALRIRGVLLEGVGSQEPFPFFYI